MRDIALVAVFAGLLPLALRHTWIGALLWTWFSLMNPHRLTYGFAFDLPFAMIIAIATLVSLLWQKGKVRLPGDPAVVVLICFLLWTCVTTMNSFYYQFSFDRLIITLKIQLMTLICIASLRERRLIELFIWVNVISIGFYGVKGGVFAIASGGGAHVWGPANSYIEDNNALGLALVMTIPLMNYLRVVSPRPWVRRGLLVAMLLCVFAVLSTQSRGAFLAISAMSFVMWTRMKRKLLPALVMVVAALVLLAFMPASWDARMQTIGSYDQDTSALQRLNAWATAINVANDRITGAGFGINISSVFAKYAPNPEWVFTAHSIYFQVLGEHGYIGLVLFLSMGALGFIYASKLRGQALQRPETEWLYDLAGMIQVSMVGYAVGGAFLSLAYFDLPYNILVMLIASKYWLREERWRTEAVGAFGATSEPAIRRHEPRPDARLGHA